MKARTTGAAICAAALLTLTACSSSDDHGEKGTSSPGKAGKAAPSATPSTGPSAAGKAAGIPPEPTTAQRAELLRALAAANPDIVKYEDRAIDAARNQCGAINGGAQNLDRSAAQRFTYKDVTTTEKQGKQINEALKGLGFCQS